MDQIYNSVRSFFSTQVFQDGKNYLSIASSPLNGSYDPTINVDTTPPIDFISGDLSSTNVKR
jgi:hypothetical protein